MNEPTTLEELTTEWVNENQERIRFAAWVKTLTQKQIHEYKSRFARCEDAPCCGCCN